MWPFVSAYALRAARKTADAARIEHEIRSLMRGAATAGSNMRGIPVIYYGSETGFERGTKEHAGNRNYYGQERIDAASASPIYPRLKRIANLRAATPALQRGLQVDVEMQGDQAAFYRVLQEGKTAQIALVLLNKGATPARFVVRQGLQAGTWKPAFGGAAIDVAVGGQLESTVAPHDVAVFLLDAPVTDASLKAQLDHAMARARRHEAAPVVPPAKPAPADKAR